MQNVSAGENTRDFGFTCAVNESSSRHSVKLYISSERELVFGDKTAGEKKRVAGDIFFRACNGASLFVNLSDCNARKTLAPVYLYYGV